MKIVVKVGTSSLTHENGQLNLRKIEHLVRVLADIENAGHDVILVSSGAIAVGAGKLKFTERPATISDKQAAAAVGQCELMYMYDRLFTGYNRTVAQILLASDDIGNPKRKENFMNTMLRLLSLGVIPIVNENDTIDTEEFGVGDNDTLSAIVSSTISADLLVLLSDIDGLFTKDPHQDESATLIPVVPEITKEIEDLAGGAGTARGTGGMATKIRAAKIVTEAGLDMVIANGKDPDILYDIVDGKDAGTRFMGKKK